jgi:hypothetical protein
MKPLDLLKNVPTPARRLFRPMLMISLVLHGVVLMLPLPPDQQKPKASRQQQQVKVTQLPTTRPSLKSSSLSSINPSPQSELPLSQSIPPISSLNPNPQPNFELNQSTPFEPPTRRESIATRQRSTASSSPIRTSSSRSQEQQPKKEEEQQQSTEEPTRSQPSEQPKRSQSTEESTPSQSTQQPAQTQTPAESTPSPSPQQPTPSPSTDDPNPSNEEGGYTALLNQNQNQLFFKAAIEQVKYKFSEDKLKQFQAELDINKLNEADKFKDATGKPDARFDFRQKAISPLKTQDIAAALEEQLKTQNFTFNKIGTYGDGPIYEVTKGDFKRYLILAPGKDEQKVDITAIVVSQSDPR